MEKFKVKINPLSDAQLSFIEGMTYTKARIYKDLLNDKNLNLRTTLISLNIAKSTLSKFGKLKNIFDDIDKMDPATTYFFGQVVGQIKAFDFAIKHNLNKKLIEEQWFIEANKFENFKFHLYS